MKILAKCMAGSRLYGMETPESDTDYSEIYMPTLKQMLLGTARGFIPKGTSAAKTRNTASDVDSLVYSLAHFIKLACAGKQQVIDMLHSKGEVALIDSPIWQDLQQHRHMFYSRSMSSSVDFIYKQIMLYGIRTAAVEAMTRVRAAIAPHIKGAGNSPKLREIVDILPVSSHTYFVVPVGSEFREIQSRYLPSDGKFFYRVDGSLVEGTLSANQLWTLLNVKLENCSKVIRKLRKENEGQLVKWSEVSHALRVGYQVLHILNEGTFEYPLPETPFLMDVKLGLLDFRTQIQPKAEALISTINRLMFVSSLPETADSAYWDQWLLDTYATYYGLTAIPTFDAP